MNIQLFATFAVFIIFVLMVIKPFYVLPVFIVGIFVEPTQFFPQLRGYNLPLVLFAIVLVGWMIHMAVYGHFSSPKSKQTKFLFLFILWTLISFFTVEGSQQGPYIWLLRSMVPYFFFLYLVQNEKELNITILSFVIFGCIGAIYGVYCLKANIGITDRGIKRIYSFFSNPNAFSNTCTLLIPFALGFFFMQYKKHHILTKTIFFNFLLLLGTGIVISYSRKSPFIIIVSLLSFILLNFENRKKLSVLFWTIMVLICVMFVFPDRVKWRYMNRIENMFKAESLQEVDLGRTETAKAGYIMMLENPLLGVGVGGFKSGYIDVAQTTEDVALVSGKNTWGEEGLGAHNLYVQVGAQFGLVGLIFFLLFVWSAYREAREAEINFRKTNSANLQVMAVSFKVFIITYLALGVFSGMLSSKLFWVLTPLISVLRKISLDHLNKNLGNSGQLEETSE